MEVCWTWLPMLLPAASLYCNLYGRQARSSMPPDKAAQDRMAQLQTELANCVMNNSWFWCLGGVLLSIPLGIKTKSYAPLLFLGAGGSAIDILHGWTSCTEQRKALAEHQRKLEAVSKGA